MRQVDMAGWVLGQVGRGFGADARAGWVPESAFERARFCECEYLTNVQASGVLS